MPCGPPPCVRANWASTKLAKRAAKANLHPVRKSRFHLWTLAALLALGSCVLAQEAPVSSPSPLPTPAASPEKPSLEPAIRERLEKLLAAEPDNVAALLELGGLESRVRNFDAALPLLQRAVRLAPEDVNAWLALGVAACDAGKLDLALAALSQAVVLEPRNAKAHGYLGVTVGRKGWIDGAEAELQRALEIDDSLPEAHFNLAVIYLQEKPPMVELARRHYQRARDLGAAPDSLVEKQLTTSKK